MFADDVVLSAKLCFFILKYKVNSTGDHDNVIKCK